METGRAKPYVSSRVRVIAIMLILVMSGFLFLYLNQRSDEDERNNLGEEPAYWDEYRTLGDRAITRRQATVNINGSDASQHVVQEATPVSSSHEHCRQRITRWISYLCEKQGILTGDRNHKDGGNAFYFHQNEIRHTLPKDRWPDALLHRAYPNEYFLHLAKSWRDNERLDSSRNIANGVLSEIAALAVVWPDPRLLPILKSAENDFIESESQHYQSRDFPTSLLVGLASYPGELEHYVLTNYSCLQTSHSGRLYTAKILYDLYPKTGVREIFDIHLASCSFCLGNTNSEFKQAYQALMATQAKEENLRGRERELLSFPWDTMASSEGSREFDFLLATLGKYNSREYTGDLRMAIDELRRASGIPESPADIAEYKKQWAFPYSKNKEAEYEVTNWAGTGSRDAYLQKKRAAETLETMIWTLHKLGGPLTPWEYQLLYHYRIVGDPKEHLRALGWITWPAPQPGQPDCPPPDFKFE